MPDPVVGVDKAFWYILVVSLILLTGITITMIYFVIRFRRSKNPEPEDIRGDWRLEVAWTAIPTIIALTMFYFGWESYIGLRTVPPDAIPVEVIAQQFSWIFVYENEKETENDLVVPVNKPVKLNITSADVLHSFFVSAFRIKVDAVPGMNTYTWFIAKQTGSYDIQCTEFCGVGHADMTATLRVVPEKEYLEWLETEDEDE